MLDTIHLQLDNFQVRNNSDLTIVPGNIKMATGETNETPLFQDEKGKEWMGAKAYLNASRLNFTIKPIGGSVRAYVNFSAPKRINANNYSPIEASQLSQVFESVETELAEAGIETDLNNANFTRLDTFKNVNADEETRTYERLFGLLGASRTNDKVVYGTTTWLYKNESAQFCIYDKLEEMKHHNESVETLPNTLRFEHRCIKTPKVNAFLGLKRSTVTDMKKYGWNNLQQKAIQVWKDNYFRYEIAEVEILAESQVRTDMQYFQANFGRLWFDKYLKAYGAFHLATSAGGIGVIEKALDNLSVNRMKKNRSKRTLKEAILLMESLRTDSKSPKTLSELYAELKYKVEKTS